MKPTLIEQPFDSYLSSILKTFENDKPLSADQINFITQHEKLLSSFAVDPVIRHYLKVQRERRGKAMSFALTQEKLNEPVLKRIKAYVQQLLQQRLTHIDLNMSVKQFQHFKRVGVHELIFWHGNQFLTGAPFFLGGIPHIIYMQWGNLFGIVKLQLSFNELQLQGQVHIDLVDRKNRSLYECVKAYSEELKLAPPIPTHEQRIQETPEPHTTPTPQLTPFFKEIH